MSKHSDDYRKILNHRVPHWIRSENHWFFITICCERRGARCLDNEKSWEAIRQTTLRLMDAHRWFPHVLLAMPDHVHLLATFPRDETMRLVMRDWKRATSRFGGIEWQRGFFDRRLRSEESHVEKAAYILTNPGRAGFIRTGAHWPYVIEGRIECIKSDPIR